MNNLSGIIYCGICGKRYNFKLNANTPLYICQTKKNYGKVRCNSQTINESFLLGIIETHLNHLNKLYTPTKVKLFVREIRIDDIDITIFYKDGSISKSNSTEIIF